MANYSFSLVLVSPDGKADEQRNRRISKKVLLVGAVGYFYEQVSPDRGCVPQLCPFESGVIGVGPQIGYIIPLGSVQAYVNAKAYFEFDSHDRPSGWNGWLTLSLSPSAAASAKPAMVIK